MSKIPEVEGVPLPEDSSDGPEKKAGEGTAFPAGWTTAARVKRTAR